MQVNYICIFTVLYQPYLRKPAYSWLSFFALYYKLETCIKYGQFHSSCNITSNMPVEICIAVTSNRTCINIKNKFAILPFY